MTITNRRTSRAIAACAAITLALGLSACGADDDNEPTSTTLTVYAASSLTDTFTELGKKFEAANPGVTVTFSFGGSSDLVSQLQNGAPADVFASADTKNMDKVTADALEAVAPKDFASNTLEIVTPPDNPAKIDSFEDLEDRDAAVVICAAEVPCGAAALTVAEAAGVDLSPVSEEQNVKDVLAKVTSGEADAGLVYVTDVLAAGDAVRGIEFPESSAAVNVYPITTLKSSTNPALAQEFLDFVLSTEGQTVLRSAGFAPAP